MQPINESFELILSYLPKNNNPKDIYNRKSKLEKVLDTFNIELLSEVNLDEGIETTNESKKYLKMQTVDLKTIKLSRSNILKNT